METTVRLDFDCQAVAITYESEALRHRVCGCPCVRGLDFARVDLADNPPRSAVSQTERKDGHDDDPSGGSIGMYHACGIQ